MGRKVPLWEVDLSTLKNKWLHAMGRDDSLWEVLWEVGFILTYHKVKAKNGLLLPISAIKIPKGGVCVEEVKALRDHFVSKDLSWHRGTQIFFWVHTLVFLKNAVVGSGFGGFDEYV